MTFWDYYILFVMFWVPVMVSLHGWYTTYNHENGIIEPGSMYDHNGNYVYEDTMIESGIDPYPDERPIEVHAMMYSYINRHDLDLHDARLVDKLQRLIDKFVKERKKEKVNPVKPTPSNFLIYEESVNEQGHAEGEFVINV